MEQDTYKTKVVFRKFPDGDIIAMFYEDQRPSKYGLVCMSYMEVGQHGEASLDLVQSTELATPEEYADLKEELESIGYNLDVRKKMQRR